MNLPTVPVHAWPVPTSQGVATYQQPGAANLNASLGAACHICHAELDGSTFEMNDSFIDSFVVSMHTLDVLVFTYHTSVDNYTCLLLAC